MLLVNVWICLMIMISQQEPSLKLSNLFPLQLANWWWRTASKRLAKYRLLWSTKHSAVSHCISVKFFESLSKIESSYANLVSMETIISVLRWFIIFRFLIGNHHSKIKNHVPPDGSEIAAYFWKRLKIKSKWYHGWCRGGSSVPGNPLSAIWPIYPSSKWSSQWPYDGYICHGWMTSCGRGRYSATPECGMFWVRLSRDVFRSKLKHSSFLSRVMFISKSFFVSCAFVRFGAKHSSIGALVWTMSSSSFWNSARSPVIFCALLIRPRVFLKITFLFSTQSRCYLPESFGDS